MDHKINHKIIPSITLYPKCFKIRDFGYIFCFLLITTSQSMQVAITVDDLPLHGRLPPKINELDVVNQMLTSFKKHHLQGVYGLINGDKLAQLKNGKKVLKNWIESGQYLGNHTFNHLDLAKVSIDAYSKDIKNNEFILDELMASKDYRYFRYPYLSEGDVQHKRDAIRQFLFDENYKIAPVTVDFFEYLWNDAYIRCLNKSNKKAIVWLEKAYIEQALNALIISHELSIMLFGRDIKNVLLIHNNAFTAHMMPALFKAYKAEGVTFISLSRALTDEVYKINPNVLGVRTYTFLNQMRIARGLDNPDKVKKLYASLPENELYSICQN